jgi:STE24 endopeptidase
LTILRSSDEAPLAQPSPDPERQRQARRYAKTMRYLGWTELVITAGLLMLLVFSGLSSRISGFFNLPTAPAAVIYFVVLMVAFEVLAVPLNYYRGFVLPRRYGLSKQNLADWLGDLAKAGALMLLLGAGMVAVGYWFIGFAPGAWWLFAWGFLVIVSLVLSVLAPVVIVPMFFKMKPLDDAELKARLGELARRAGVEVSGVYNIEFSHRGTTANAAVMGAGKTKRIVLSDTLLDQYSASEIEVIMAHELGHNRHRDMLRMFVSQSVIMLVSFYLTSLILKAIVAPLGFGGLSDASALPLLVLVFGAVNLPLSLVITSYTRRVETEADGYALELTGDPASFVSAMTKLTDQNLAEAEPGRWIELLFHDHPSYRSRVAHAKNYLVHRENKD